MRLRSRSTVAVGVVAVAAGIAAPAEASAAAKPAPAGTASQSRQEEVHRLTALEAQKIMAADRAGDRRRAGDGAVVRSAGAAIPDANGGHSFPLNCNGFWQVYGGRGFADTIGYTSVDCTRYQSMSAVATVSRDRWYGWEQQAYVRHYKANALSVSAEAVWRCQGVGTYTYLNRFVAATHYGGYSGGIESRFNC
jgi:hypothetical protein